MLNALLVASLLAVTLPPEPANHISDQAQLLNSQERAQLESTFQAAYQQKGVKLGLLTLSELDDQPKVVAVRTLNYWNMSPDSVLILVSLNPKKIYLQPGENLATTFDERTSTAITRSMVPSMKAGNFGQAVLTAFDGVMVSLGGVAAAPVAPPPQVQRAAPVQPEPVRAAPRQPIVADPVQVTASAPKESGGHGFLIFLLVVGAVGVIAYFAYRQHKANERRATRRTGGFTPYRSSYDPDTGVKRSSGGSGGGTVVNNVSGGGGSSDLLTGVLVGNMLSQPSAPAQVAPPAPAPVYTPPPTPPAPRKSFSERLSDVADSLSSSRSSGGGGSSWGSSSDSGSSYSSGGGGSDWGSSSSGSDSSSGSGGGGSDW